MEWYLKVLKEHYADFNGRARRKEYWMFALFNFLAILAIIVVGALIGLAAGSEVVGVVFIALYIIYALAVIVPSIAVTVRRLHDTGKSGWMYFVSLIPLIGSLWLLVLLCTEGDRGENQYGPDPKAGER
ncbi:MAG: DUF805 domain-containing protein [Prevotella sp.]|jgi:uncharacterized membrane protein YhaH (DUF805 family)|nr:DUF805 domain-containing protein [Prevotella sp.]